ncbi:hypothetical protein KEM56_002360 [Ascosphaera pollenicola]|nr:hypothetical protein KEM56_002360 [Ascosphaera pollenicola]
MDEAVAVDTPFLSSPADHLCVLVHGLYGQPSHLDYIAHALRARYPVDKLHLLSVQRNKGNLTYDGIELGGERVAHEIEEYIHALHDSHPACAIKKLSVVGYSLGGLIARYAIGLLFARGYFDKDRITPVNFTTFATPHVGVRNPARRNHLWNVIGARTISTSGRQLFMIDEFRATGKPLLSLLATEGSVFMLGLQRFAHRSLYANVVNDRAATFYTTCISKTNPFVGVAAAASQERVNYVPGYEPVVIDNERYYIDHDDSGTGGGGAASTRSSPTTTGAGGPTALNTLFDFLRQLPFYLFLIICLPVGSIAYLFNALVQTILSRKRIQMHERRKVSTIFGSYDVPLFVESMRNATSEMMNEMYESINASQPTEYLAEDSPEREQQQQKQRTTPPQREVEGEGEGEEAFDENTPLLTHLAEQPTTTTTAEASTITTTTTTSPTVCVDKPRTLALTPAQFEIIDNLNALGFRKFPVYIHKHRHSHAAIIVRMPNKPGFAEGKVVVRHWLDNEFFID